PPRSALADRRRASPRLAAAAARSLRGQLRALGPGRSLAGVGVGQLLADPAWRSPLRADARGRALSAGGRAPPARPDAGRLGLRAARSEERRVGIECRRR